ncbi:MAG: phosphoglycerate kinase [Candidatus Heimdallarchaeota archaeon]|nr:phosphoglycerate kinase [Candidatus Heimdallarchaeota archaeon]
MLKSIKNTDIAGKRVLVRVDYNVPINDGKVMDDTRIIRSLPTIKYLLDNNAKVILISHLGRPKGEIKPELSLKPVAEHLQSVLGFPVRFSSENTGEDLRSTILTMEEKLILLENTRFHPGETKNDAEFAKELASFAEVFVSDAFGTVHRAHSSTVGVSQYLPSAAGFLVEQEYTRINSAMQSPKKPSIAIVGGAKVSTKLDVINNFIDKVDEIIVGGGMVYTFFLAKGKQVGDSLKEADMVDTARDLLQKAEKKGVTIHLPLDIALSKTFDEPWLENGEVKVVSWDTIPDGSMGLDIGPKSIKSFSNVINAANTIIWNGPMGVFEKELYRVGTAAVAKAVVERAVDTVIGGGDTAYALNLSGFDEIPEIIHISTGGGASLELMSGLSLPGIECLME